MATAILRGHSIAVELKLVTEDCVSCGLVFAMPEDFKSRLLRGDGERNRTFYCPAGHANVYTGKSEAAKLREQLDEERRNRQRAEQAVAREADWRREAEERAVHERNRANGYKGHATRITKRAKAGVCPCCNRHFVALERHMASKHPDFTPMEAGGA